MNEFNENDFFNEMSRSYVTSTKGFKGQDYESLKSECQKSGSLFIDPIFTPIDALLNYAKPSRAIKWLRPNQIVASGLSPEFIVKKAETHDLDQGALGNCWFIAGR